MDFFKELFKPKEPHEVPVLLYRKGLANLLAKSQSFSFEITDQFLVLLIQYIFINSFLKQPKMETLLNLLP